jgi:tetratricopeptide (TPR) repeat protein
MAVQLQAPSYPNALRHLIEHAGYTFREVHKETGIPERTLYDWAAGNRVVPHRDRKVLACLLGCSVEDFAPRVPGSFLVQLPQERTNEQQQGSGDMDKTRRVLLRLLGLSGTALFQGGVEPWERLTSAIIKPSNMDEGTLRHFEKVIAMCWDWSNGSKLDMVEQLLPTFLPQLSTFAQRPSDFQETAASLASQGYQLTYVITSHREDFSAAQTACKQAHYYGKLAQDANLQAAALIRQGVTYLNRKRPHQTLDSYQQALPLVDSVSPLVRTRLYAGLAEVQGKLQREQDALSSIGLAHDSFPGDTQHDPAATYIHFPYSSVFLHEGLALIDLHQPGQAVKALERVDGLHPKMDISERSRIDLLNQQALAVGQQGDLDQFDRYMQAAVTSARTLGSELRVSEAWDVFIRMRDQWKYEPRIQSLGGLFAR